MHLQRSCLFVVFPFITIFLLLCETQIFAQENKTIPQIESIDSTKTPLQIQQMKFARFLQAKYSFADSAVHAIGLYSNNLRFVVPSQKLWRWDNKQIIPELYRPDWENDFYKRASGGFYPNVSFNPVMIASQFKQQSKWEKSKKAFNNEFIPSNLQLKVMKALWQKKTATQLDIYSSLDSSVPITAELLDHQLKRMVDLGLVEREIISPQNLFTFFLPVNEFKIEMSKKNCKNRVYLYRSRVDKDKIMQYLFAQLYQVRKNGTSQEWEGKKLKDKLLILLQ